MLNTFESSFDKWPDGGYVSINITTVYNTVIR